MVNRTALFSIRERLVKLESNHRRQPFATGANAATAALNSSALISMLSDELTRKYQRVFSLTRCLSVIIGGSYGELLKPPFLI